jgi:hypothetical protein
VAIDFDRTFAPRCAGVGFSGATIRVLGIGPSWYGRKMAMGQSVYYYYVFIGWSVLFGVFMGEI